jgi:hypothetical protein
MEIPITVIIVDVTRDRLEVNAVGHGRVKVTGDEAKSLIQRMRTAFDGDVASEITIDLSGRFLSRTAVNVLRSYFHQKGARSTNSDFIVFPESSVHFVRLIGITGWSFPIDEESLIVLTDFKTKI